MEKYVVPREECKDGENEKEAFQRLRLESGLAMKLPLETEYARCGLAKAPCFYVVLKGNYEKHKDIEKEKPAESRKAIENVQRSSEQ
jgi:hypothetical protein